MSKEPGQTAFEAACPPMSWRHADQRTKDIWAAVEAAVRADERERCAKIAEGFGADPAPASDGCGTRILRAVDGHQIAAAIHAAKEGA